MSTDSKFKTIGFKVRAVSKESTTAKSSNISELDMRNHWSTNTNSKEWILLELDEACLLTQIRIQNKSVSEWEITVALKNKADSFVKVKAKGEAPRKDVTYHVNHIPCRYVKIYCFRGSPISIFFVQVLGIEVPGLIGEFQPVVDHLAPQISNAKDIKDPNLQLLRDITRLAPIVSSIRTELESDSMEESLRFLKEIVGVFFPLVNLSIVIQKENEASLEPDLSDMKAPVVTSNFKAPTQKKKSETELLISQPTMVINALKLAYQNPLLHKMAEKISQSLGELDKIQKASTQETTERKFAAYEWNALMDDIRPKLAAESLGSIFFGCIADEHHCQTLVDNSVDFMSILPLLRVLSPTLRVESQHLEKSDPMTIKLSPIQEKALSLIITLTTNPHHISLVRELASYLCSSSVLQETAACVLLDLSVGSLAPWISSMPLKANYLMDLLTDSLHFFQPNRKDKSKAKALITLMRLTLSGHIDERIEEFIAAKHSILFLVQLLSRPLNLLLERDRHLKPTRLQDTQLALNLLFRSLNQTAVLETIEQQLKEHLLTPSAAFSLIAPDLPLPSRLKYEEEQMVHSPDREAEPKREKKEKKEKEETSKFFVPKDLMEELQVEQVDEKDQVPSSKEDELSPLAVQFAKKPHELLSIEDYFQLDAEFLQLSSYSLRSVKAKQFSQFAEVAQKKRIAEKESQDGKHVHETAISALLLAAECHLNPYFMNRVGVYQDKLVKQMNQWKKEEGEKGEVHEGEEVEEIVWNSASEETRDTEVMKLLIRAAKWDAEYRNVPNEDITGLEVTDLRSVDLITLVRMHQQLLFHFLRHFLNESQTMLNEVLLQGLIYLIRSVTSLPNPGELVKTILNCVAKFNNKLQKKYMNPDQYYSIESTRRYWALMHKLIELCVCSHGNNIIQLSDWIESLESIQTSKFPLVRYFGYMALSRALVSIPHTSFPHTHHWTSFLKIFFDDIIAFHRGEKNEGNEETALLFPELLQWFPTFSASFYSFALSIKRSLMDHIRNAKPSEVPDLLSWFLELVGVFNNNDEKSKEISLAHFQKANYNSLIATFTETLLRYQIDQIIPEVPRLLNVILALCSNSVTSPDLLEKIFALIQPIFKREDKAFVTVFENFSMDKLRESITVESPQDILLFLLAKLLPEFSEERKKEVIAELPRWVKKRWTPKDTFIRLKGFTAIFIECRDPSEVAHLQAVIPILWSAVDSIWESSPALCQRLVEASFECLLSGIGEDKEKKSKLMNKMVKYALQLQAEDHWAVAGATLDLVLLNDETPLRTLPRFVESVHQRSKRAPRLEWRIQSVELFETLLGNINSAAQFPPESPTCLFVKDLLGHPEQELRSTVLDLLLHHLSPPEDKESMFRESAGSIWQWVLPLALQDPFSSMKLKSMEVLSKCIPLLSTDSRTSFVVSIQELCIFYLETFLRETIPPYFKAAELIATILIFDSAEAIQNFDVKFWKLLEEVTQSTSTNISKGEKQLAEMILHYKNDPSETNKEALQTSLQGDVVETSEVPSELLSARDSILEVLVRVQAEEREQEREEDETKRALARLEELEIEAELIQEEKELALMKDEDLPKEESGIDKETKSTEEPNPLESLEDRISRLEAKINAERRSAKVEEIKSRRRLAKILEHEREIAFHRAQMQRQWNLMQLDSQRQETEMKELERQQILEAEREKTKEIRFQMELEAEKKLQKELESREVQPVRRTREYSARRERQTREDKDDEVKRIDDDDSSSVDEGESKFLDRSDRSSRGKPRERRETRREVSRKNEGKWERKQ